MKKKRLPKSLRKHIRREKARIHREVFDLEQKGKLIQELNKKYFKNSPKGGKNENKRNL